MIAWLRRLLTPDTAHLEARLLETQTDRDYWRRVAERLLDEALAQRPGASPAPVFDRPGTAGSGIPVSPFEDLFAAMTRERVSSKP